MSLIYVGIVVVGLGAIGLLFEFVHYGTLPFFLNQETTAFRSSNGFVDTKADLLLKLEQDYQSPEATPAQRAAIVNRMKAERALLRPEQVPAEVDAFLAGK